MKRSRLATFKVKKLSKFIETRKKIGIGDYFVIDFDRCLSDIKNNGYIYIENQNLKIYPDEVYLIRVTYIDKYDVDIDKEYNEIKKLIKNNDKKIEEFSK